MKTHALASTTLTCSPSVSGHFTHCWVSLCTSCCQFKIIVAVTNLLNFDQFLIEIHTATTGLWRCCLYISSILRLVCVCLTRQATQVFELWKVTGARIFLSISLRAFASQMQSHLSSRLLLFIWGFIFSLLFCLCLCLRDIFSLLLVFGCKRTYPLSLPCWRDTHKTLQTC